MIERSNATDRALDALLDSLYAHGFSPPGKQNRDALAAALIDAAIKNEIRIRIDDLRCGSKLR